MKVKYIVTIPTVIATNVLIVLMYFVKISINMNLYSFFAG